VTFPPSGSGVCEEPAEIAVSFGAQSGRGFVPHFSGGTPQLSTRCSSEALLLSRSFKVWGAWLAGGVGSSAAAAPADSNPQSNSTFPSIDRLLSPLLTARLS
jgi:hypothetical protein